MKTKIQGFRAKTINIFLGASTTKFRLQNNNELGLPGNAIIQAIQCRTPTNDGRVSNGDNMVNATVFANSYLNLKYRKSNRKIDLLTQAYYLPNLITNALFLNPVESCAIDWNESFIQINQRAQSSVVVGSFYELIIYYSIECEEKVFSNRLKFRSGYKRLGIQVAKFEIEIFSGQPIYRISNTENVGLPLDAWVVGYNTSQPAFPLSDGITQGLSKSSSFITLKRGTELFIDAYPTEIVNYKTALIPDFNYMPIEPIEVIKVDWSNSFLQIFNNSIIASTEIFSFELYWFQPNL